MAKRALTAKVFENNMLQPYKQFIKELNITGIL